MLIGVAIETTSLETRSAHQWEIGLRETYASSLCRLMNRRSDLRLLAVISVIVCSVVLWSPSEGKCQERRETSGRIWKQIIVEAEALGLPTTFLKHVPADFVRFEFADLRAFAAEYHLEEHRMVLNRAVSFNAAGATLRPLRRLTPTQMETLYHELFHAYMDYLRTNEADGVDEPFLTFAREQQRCRYSVVLITPMVQRKSETEQRFLSERESWEALNEAWAVFVGWSIWNQIELSKRAGASITKPGRAREGWLQRLEEADREGKLRGYYEPEDLAERKITRKRILAPESRLSEKEIVELMRDVLEYPAELAQEANALLSRNQAATLAPAHCD